MVVFDRSHTGLREFEHMCLRFFMSCVHTDHRPQDELRGGGGAPPGWRGYYSTAAGRNDGLFYCYLQTEKDKNFE